MITIIIFLAASVVTGVGLGIIIDAFRGSE